MNTITAIEVPAIGAYRPSMLERFGRNRFVLGGAAVTLLAAGLAWQWSWLVAIGVAPLLLSVAPCAVMCALGVCVMSKAGSSCNAAKADASVASGDSTPIERPNR